MYALNNHIIEAKINPPIIKSNILERNELIRKVKSNAKAKLTIITAPGGYGKTILTHQIVESTGKPFLWYHLDEVDNDPIVFFYYIFNGFSKYISGFNKEISIILRGIETGKDNAYGIAAFFIEEIEKIQCDKICLVLDDFHVIKDKYIVDFLNVFIKYSSEKIHIIINSRKYPDLDISKLRQADTLIEIEKNEIKFSFDEFLSIISKEKQSQYEKSIIEKVYEKSEGWPLALNVFIKEFKKNYNKMEEYINYIQSGESFFDYFIFEVFNNLSQDIKEFLLKISVIDRITPDVCNYLSNNLEASNILKYLVKNNIFINKISNKGEMYTCHQLFKKFLQNQLGARIKKYYLKAGEFYFIEKNYEEAIEYFIKCKDSEKTLKVFKYAGIEAIRKGRLKTAERWIDFFNDDELNKNKWIILAKSSIALYKGMFDMSEKYLNEIINYFNKEEEKYGYCIALVIKSRILLYRYSFNKCIETANLIIQISDEVEELTLYEAFMQKSYGQTLKGDFDEAVITLELGAEILNRRGAKRLALFAQRYLILPYFLKFEYHKVILYYNITYNMSDDETNLTERFSIDLYLARTYRDMGRLTEAKSIMENTIRKKQALGYVEDIFAVYYQLATLYRDLGDYEAALKYASLSERLFKCGGSNMEFAYLAKALKALILSDVGNIKESIKLIKEALQELITGDSKFMVEVAYHSAGLIYIRAGEYEEAIKYLECGYKMAGKTGLRSMIVVCGGILSGIYLKYNKIVRKDYAKENLELAAKQNYIQVFLTNPEMDGCTIIGFVNNIEENFIESIIKKLSDSRIKNMLKWLIVNSDYETILRFLLMVEIKQNISKETFEKIAISFLTCKIEEKRDFSEFINKLRPMLIKQSGSIPKLIICCFGRFRAYSPLVDDVRIKWRTNKSKELLAYFIHNCGKEILTEKILADIWQDSPEEKARELFYTNIALVRQILKKCEIKDNLIKIQSGYIFKEEGIYCDEWIVNKYKNNDYMAEYDVENIFKREYLEDIYSDWACETRMEYENFNKKG